MYLTIIKIFNYTSTIMNFSIPIHCPQCKAELQLTSTGIDLFCPNVDHCPAQVTGRMSYFCQRNLGNITGMSDKTIERLIKEFNISDIADLYDLPFDKISKLEGFGPKSSQNIQKSTEKAREIKDYKFLAGLGIDGIGPEIAKLICDLIP
jgi:DNA ligase (NAD+)